MVTKRMNELRGKLLEDIENIAKHQMLTTDQEMAMLKEVYTCFRNLRQIMLDASKQNFSENLFNFGLDLSRVTAEMGGLNHDISDEKLYVHANQGGIERGQNNGRGAL